MEISEDILAQLRPVPCGRIIRLLRTLEEQYQALYPETARRGRRPGGQACRWRNFSQHVAPLIGRPASTIRYFLALAHGLPEETIDLIDAGRISQETVHYLSRYPVPDQARILAHLRDVPGLVRMQQAVHAAAALGLSIKGRAA
jgi:hypothetical protein